MSEHDRRDLLSYVFISLNRQMFASELFSGFLFELIFLLVFCGILSHLEQKTEVVWMWELKGGVVLPPSGQS